MWLLGKFLGLEFDGPDSKAIENIEEDLKAFLPNLDHGNEVALLERQRTGQCREDERGQGAFEEALAITNPPTRDKTRCAEGESDSELCKLVEL